MSGWVFRMKGGNEVVTGKPAVGSNFIRTRLLCGMQPGKQYEVSMYVFSKYNILDSIGICFSANDFLVEKRRFTEISPQLRSANGFDSVRKPHSEWQRIRLLYTATGEEGYITIGCFKRNDYAINQADYRD